MLLGFIIFIGCLCLWDYIVKKPKNDMTKMIPSVTSFPLIGASLALSSFTSENQTEKFTEYHNRYGKTYKCWIAHQLYVTTSDLKYVEPILDSKQHITKHFVYSFLREWLGEGLLLSTGSKWQSRRKMIAPAFHFKSLEQFVEVFNEQSLILVQKLKQFADGETTVDVYPLVCLATLDIIAETAMGTQIRAQDDANSRYADAVKDVTNILAMRFMRPHLSIRKLFKMLKPKLYNKQLEGILYMHLFTKRIIEDRRKAIMRGDTNDGDSDDTSLGIKKRRILLDLLLQSKSTGGKLLSDDEIREEMDTFMFAGHDTTTSAISFALRLIASHPEVQQRMFEEIKALYGDDITKPITYSDLVDLQYMNCVVRECLRLFPPIPAIGRRLKEDLRTKDCTIPAGTHIIIILWQILRDPSNFADPLVFKPERFLVENSHANVFSYIPFSAGPRTCIGQKFALLEMKCLLTQILRHYELLPLGENVQPNIMIVLRSKNGINLGFKQRVY